MRICSLPAVAAAGLLAGVASTAHAADFGGNCCLDLEERIAELEATAARKGNRNVSLTVSGWVTQNVMWWDDGVDENLYITDSGSVSIGTHVKFAGLAHFAPGWSAGYVLNIELVNNDSLGVNQFNGGNGGNVFANFQAGSSSGNAISIESSYWFLKSEQLGRVGVGKQSSAADNQAIIVDGSGSLVPANYVLYDVRAFFLRNGTNQGLIGPGGLIGNRQWLDLADCAPNGGALAGDCDGYPLDSVRYDSPTFGGLSFSASWGEDDMWAVSARWARELGGFKIAVAGAYNESQDDGGAFGMGRVFGLGHDAAAWQAGAYVQHVASGLFIYVAYAGEEQDAGFFANDPEGDMWYGKVGIRQRWMALGNTVLYGEYGRDEDKISSDLAALGATGGELERYGIGLVQEIDNAAMSLWIAWRHYEGDITCSNAAAAANGFVANCAASNLNAGNTDLEEFDLIKAGALINF